MLILALALAINYAAMALLCLGLARHYKQFSSKAPQAAVLRAIRGAGWVLLLVGLWVCSQAWGWAMGPVAWLGLISLAGLAIALLLPYRPKLAIQLAGLPIPLSLFVLAG